MIPGDLFSIFSQIAVGVFALWSLTVLYWAVTADHGRKYCAWLKSYFAIINRRVDQLFQARMDGESFDKGKPFGASQIAIFFVIIFGAGITLHATVDDIVDSKSFALSIISKPLRFVLGSETGYRFSALFEHDDITFGDFADLIARPGSECIPWLDYKTTSLGRELFAHKGSYVIHADISDNYQTEFLKDPNLYLLENNADKCEAALHFARKLYYDALHYSQGVSEYAGLINYWKTEINFLGGIFLCAALLITVLVFVSIRWYLVVDNKNVITSARYPAKYQSARKIIMFAIPVAIVSSYGYSVSTRNLVERAYGVYASHLNIVAAETGSMYKPSTEKVQATSWVLLSKEYDAIAKQTYRAAALRLKTLGDDCIDGRRRCVVVLDLDETVLSNADYEELLRKTGLKHTKERFETWWNARINRGEVDLVPGAKEFILGARDNNVLVRYITARSPGLRKVTLEALKKKGLISEDMGGSENNDDNSHVCFVQDWENGDKASCRQEIEKLYRVVAYIGDDMNDLDECFYYDHKYKTKCESNIVANYIEDNIGKSWFVLPNPIYGNWARQ